MDFFPVVFIIFKLMVLGAGMFFAVKWHYEKGKKETVKALLPVGKIAAAFVILLVGLIYFTFFVAEQLGLNLKM